MAKDFTKVLKGASAPEEPKRTEEPIKEPKEIKETKAKDLDKASFTFKASKETLSDLRALATITKTTQADIIERALLEYFKNHNKDYELAKKLRKEFNL